MIESDAIYDKPIFPLMARWDREVALIRDKYDMSHGYGVGKVHMST